jgi:hypothetical protein
LIGPGLAPHEEPAVKSDLVTSLQKSSVSTGLLQSLLHLAELLQAVHPSAYAIPPALLIRPKLSASIHFAAYLFGSATYARPAFGRIAD